jgi:predicted RNase H-like HicB family nuclease
MNPDSYSIILVWSEEDEAFIATVPELDGCTAHGETRTEAIGQAEIAIENWPDTARGLGREIPEPKDWTAYEAEIEAGAEEDFRQAMAQAVAENAQAIAEALARKLSKETSSDVSVLWQGGKPHWVWGPPKGSKTLPGPKVQPRRERAETPSE